MNRLVAVLAGVLLLLGPLGLAGLHHGGLHSSCESTDTECPSSGGSGNTELQSTPCWICSALTHSPGAVFAPSDLVSALVASRTSALSPAGAPRIPELLRPSSRAPPLA
jgi:hypothetical protein